MQKSKFTIVLFTLIGVLVLAGVVSAAITTISVDTTINTAQVISGRIFRDGVVSDCAGKAFPGDFAVGYDFGYDVHGPYTPAVSGCVTVNFDPDSAVNACGTNAHAMAFRDTFTTDWVVNGANYLGDVGSSLAQPFSFPVVAGEPFVIAVSNTSSADACSYHFDFTYDLGDVAGAGCTLPVPSGSVVGDAPFETQAYYEPGNAAPGVVLNPGTYIVIGQDASETYYQIVLACQYLWVRKDAMQPSYEQPQNGAPLPTRIIEASSGAGAAPASTGSANDL